MRGGDTSDTPGTPSEQRVSHKSWNPLEGNPFPVSVVPRVSPPETRGVIAFDGEHILVERTGEIHPAAELPLILVTEPPGLLVAEQASVLLVHLNQTVCARLPGWQYRVSPVVRRVYRQHRRERATEAHDVLVAFLGWRSDSRHTHYHYPLDPFVFSGHPIRRMVNYPEGRAGKLQALMTWGIDIRAWCQTEGLKVSGSSGSLAVQLLKDPRFYPDARRKVPRATNDRARIHLPGNHYELFTPTGVYRDALYLDMKSAHHTCAAETPLPEAGGLLARGRFRNPPEEFVGREVWTRADTPTGRALLQSHGLLLVRLESLRPHEKYTLPYLRKAGMKLQWVFTNELPLIQELGGRVFGIEAAWTSWQSDEGIPKFARWAMEQTQDMNEIRKRWAKPVLLSVYGMLAARPEAREYGYATAANGEQAYWMTPAGPLPVSVTRQQRETESPVANVIHRGMIEAEVRGRVIHLARELAGAGVEVLALYADSVIVSTETPLPFLPPPWEVKSPMSRLRFLNPVSFTSDEMTKLPGVPSADDHHRMMVATRFLARGPVADQRRREGRPLPLPTVRPERDLARNVERIALDAAAEFRGEPVDPWRQFEKR